MKQVYRGVTIASVLLASYACNHDRLLVANYNNPTPGSISGDPINGLQFLSTAMLAAFRTNTNQASNFGILGRESYNFFATDARSQQNYLKANPLDPAGFAVGPWAGPYTNRRNVFNFLSTVDGITTGLNAPQKDAARGFAKTVDAVEMMYLILSKHDQGAVVDILPDPKQLAPFVSRDSVYNWVAGRLDEAKANLVAGAGAAAFPFVLHNGFNTNGDFRTPSRFLQINRAFAARNDVYRASLGNPACGANGKTCYDRALAELAESFLNPAASLYLGAYNIYSADAGDTRNGLNSSVNPDLVAHPSDSTDAPFKADGSLDNRYVAKIRTLKAADGSVQSRLPTGGAENGIPTHFGFQIYTTDVSPVPIIRNEELILIRAEARWFAGSSADKPGAIADINLIRTTSGGLTTSSLTPASSDADFVTELLLQRRFSLLWEGHRWVDVRRFGRLNTLPLDLPTMFRIKQQPIPSSECDLRSGQTGPLACPANPPTPQAP